jgi:hypothetical protein
MNGYEQDIDSIIEAVNTRRMRGFDEEFDPASQKPGTHDSCAGTAPELSAIDCSFSPINQKHEAVLESGTEASQGDYRLFQFWPGNNIFCLDGRMLNGLNRQSLQKKFAILVVLAIFTIYMLFPALHLYEKISPYLTLITIYMFILTVFFYVMTSA